MERIKQQFGSGIVDGKERKYCNISLVIDTGSMISKESLEEQLKLVAESFWTYLNAQEESIENIGAFNKKSSLDFDEIFLEKEWEAI